MEGIRFGYSRRQLLALNPGFSLGALAPLQRLRTDCCAREQGHDVYAVPGNVTNKNSWRPNTMIQQGAKRVATWEDVWEALPQDVRLALTPPAGAESQAGQTASLFEEPSLSPHEKKISSVLKADEAMHLDEILERLEPDLSSSENFAARFELELAGWTGEAASGEEFCKRLLAVSYQLSAKSKGGAMQS